MAKRQVRDNGGGTVFISHSGVDTAQALSLHSELEKVGISARLDHVDLRLGDDIVHWISQSITESDYLLLLLSSDSLESYWVGIEWSAAISKEAELRRTFLIPVLLPGADVDSLPLLLRRKLVLDLRTDPTSAFLRLVARIKSDSILFRDAGSRPSPGTSAMEHHLDRAFPEVENGIDIILRSNRFGRNFRLTIPRDATAGYILGMARDTLGLTYSNRDDVLQVELRYSYSLRVHGQSLPLNTNLGEAGIRANDVVEIWIQVALQDLHENRTLSTGPRNASSEQIPLLLRAPAGSVPSSRPVERRSFSSSDIREIASKFFSHVDE